MPTKYRWPGRAGLLLFALVLFALPIWVLQGCFLHRYTAFPGSIALVSYALERLEGRKILLVGDSTIRELLPSPESIDGEKEIANLAIEGSRGVVWYYLLREAFARRVRSSWVLVGASTPGEYAMASYKIDRYQVPWTSLADIARELRAHTLLPTAALQLLNYKLLPVLHSRSEILEFLVGSRAPRLDSVLPFITSDPFLRESEGIKEEATRLGWRLDPLEYVKRIVALANENGARVAFVFSPTHSEKRKDPLMLTAHARFRDACASLRLDCWDLSREFPDSEFLPDGIHLQPHKLPAYLQLLRAWVHDRAH